MIFSGNIYRPTFAEIDISALKNNFRLIKDRTKVKLMPVVKANAYGHGAVQIATALQEEGADFFGVATIEEGIELRENSIKTPILILGSIYPMDNFKIVVENNLTPIISSKMALYTLEEIAKDQGVNVNVHLKIDTGMGRIGVNYKHAVDICNEIERSEFLNCEGIFTHLAAADSDSLYTVQQIDNLQSVINQLDIVPENVHVANTAAVLNNPGSYFTLVRPGIAMYGLYPEKVAKDSVNFSPVLSWKSKIVFLKDIKKGSAVSYGATWTAPKNSKIATICVGYADGFKRSLSNKASVLISGHRCPVIGRVCMDMIMVDVTELNNVSTGSEVVLIGRQGDEFISSEEMAEWASTINYEITTGISYRVPRVYVND